ncbi:hypothetical protein CHARACLAT_014193 [Characodon lateralis]|uniref:Uncharacterized protein n=1 Tax=Characodon lateralis TaxID=208331 RepID=A0ABU7CXG9_9TELE|nr:hypothetical protein [Characodon lateralis]
MQNSETAAEMIYGMEMYNPRISETYSNMNTKELQQSRRLSYNRCSTNSTFSTSKRSTFYNDSYLSWSDVNVFRFESQIKKLTEMPSEQDDRIVVYEHEGEVGSCGSVDELSLDSEEDLNFLDTLMPQFNTLGKICSTQLDQVKRSKL